MCACECVFMCVLTRVSVCFLVYLGVCVVRVCACVRACKQMFAVSM